MNSARKTGQWSAIENQGDYQEAIAYFEKIRMARKGNPAYKEMLELVRVISVYEAMNWSLPDVSSAEMMKIRLEDFGYKKQSAGNRSIW